MKAIHCVVGDETYNPGDIFLVNDNVEALRLIETGAAVPVRKKITLSFSSKSKTDGVVSDLMDERRQSDSNKTVIKVGCDVLSANAGVSISDDGDQQGIGAGVLTSLDKRAQDESDNVFTH